MQAAQPRRRSTLIALLTGAAVLLGITGASAENGGDVREFRIGQDVHSLSTDDYYAFACAADGARTDLKLASWVDFAACPRNAQGLHEVRFDYKRPDQEVTAYSRKWLGTKIAGHRVWLSLLIDEAGVIAGIKYRTDPTASEFFKKKAYLLGQRVKRQYGDMPWQCQKVAGADKLSPVGGVYINEECRQELTDRTIFMTTKLYREPDQDLEDFVNETRVAIYQKGLAD